jgi:hypothetical protein
MTKTNHRTLAAAVKPMAVARIIELGLFRTFGEAKQRSSCGGSTCDNWNSECGRHDHRGPSRSPDS